MRVIVTMKKTRSMNRLVWLEHIALGLPVGLACAAWDQKTLQLHPALQLHYHDFHEPWNQKQLFWHKQLGTLQCFHRPVSCFLRRTRIWLFPSRSQSWRFLPSHLRCHARMSVQSRCRRGHASPQREKSQPWPRSMNLCRVIVRIRRMIT